MQVTEHLGHKKVAEVIAKTFKDREKTVDVRVFDSLDMTPWVFKKSYPATYFYAVKYLPAVWGWFYETLDIKKFIPQFIEICIILKDMGYKHNDLHSHNMGYAGDVLGESRHEGPPA